MFNSYVQLTIEERWAARAHERPLWMGAVGRGEGLAFINSWYQLANGHSAGLFSPSGAAAGAARSTPTAARRRAGMFNSCVQLELAQIDARAPARLPIDVIVWPALTRLRWRMSNCSWEDLHMATATVGERFLRT